MKHIDNFIKRRRYNTFQIILICVLVTHYNEITCNEVDTTKNIYY